MKMKKLFGAVLAASVLVSGMTVSAAELKWFDFNSGDTFGAWFTKVEKASIVDGKAALLPNAANWETAKIGSYWDWYRNIAIESKFTLQAAENQEPRVRYMFRVDGNKPDLYFYSFMYTEYGGADTAGIYKWYQTQGNEYTPKRVALYQPGTTTPAEHKFEGGLPRDVEYDIKIMCYGTADTGVYINVYLDGELLLQGYDHPDCNYELTSPADEAKARAVYASGNFYFDVYDGNGYLDDLRLYNLYRQKQLGEEDNWAWVDDVPDNEITFSQNDAMLRDTTAITPGSEVAANAYIVNDTGAALARNLIVGWYDADGNLQSVGVSPLSLDGENEKIGLASASLTLPEELEGGKLRAFLWNGAAMQPVVMGEVSRTAQPKTE